MVKRYRSTYADDVEMLVDIDHSILTDEKLHEINNFWNDARWRVSQEDGNITHAVLKMLHRRVLYLDMSLGFTLEATIEQFNYDNDNGQEGWPKMDGSEGITIVAFDSLDISCDRMVIEEVA